MAKANHQDSPESNGGARSKFGSNAYAHAGSGDVKLGRNQPGCSTLPDGTVALTGKLIGEVAAASEQAKSRPPERERG